MPYLSPPTLTADEQRSILRFTAGNPRDHLIFSLALGTGLRLGEIVGLDVGDVFAPDGTPRVRIRIRAEIAKGGRAGDVFLPDRLLPKLRRFWRCKVKRGEGLQHAEPLFCNQSTPPDLEAPRPVRVEDVAEAGGVRPPVLVSLDSTHVHNFGVPDVPGPLPGTEVCEACEPADDRGVHPPLGPGAGREGPGIALLRLLAASPGDRFGGSDLLNVTSCICSRLQSISRRSCRVECGRFDLLTLSEKVVPC